ncbi:hypothetical protein P3T73_17195 [Kiritimatiellota bacterium B12222]|nr:hypothetical protein P3T73_17195 [Kiritimatiellota bacterium B12222]
MKNNIPSILFLSSVISLSACNRENGGTSLEETGRKADEAIAKSAHVISDVSADVKASLKENSEKIAATTEQVIEDSKEWSQQQLDAADAATKKAANALGEEAVKAGEALKQVGKPTVTPTPTELTESTEPIPSL